MSRLSDFDRRRLDDIGVPHDFAENVIYGKLPPDPMNWRDRPGALNLPNRTPMPEWHDPDPEGTTAEIARMRREMDEAQRDLEAKRELFKLQDFHAAVTTELDNFDQLWRMNNIEPKYTWLNGEADLAARAIFNMGKAIEALKKDLSMAHDANRKLVDSRDHWRKVASAEANDPHSLWWHIKRWNRTRIRLPVRDGGPK